MTTVQQGRSDSGRDRLLSNLLASWLAHGVTIIVGFVMPRLIYETVGQTVLGLWDLGWSLLVYTAFSGLGFAPAVTHYVARRRAEGDHESVSRTIATAWYCQLCLALLAALGFVGIFIVVVSLLPELDTGTVRDVMLMAVLLSLTVFTGLAGDIAQGVISGYHRMSANEYIGIGADVVLALAMVGVLLFGGGLIWLAIVTLCTRLAFEALRMLTAWRACPEISLRVRDWHPGLAMEMGRYSLKSVANAAQEMILHQLTRLILVVVAGPAALAAFSRYTTLVRQLGRTTERMTVMIRPMVSSLVGLGRSVDVVQLYRRAANAAVLVTLPLVSLLAVFGDIIVSIWMGPEFIVPGLAWVLALMAALNADRIVSMQVLGGVNRHGWVAGISLLTSLLVFGAALAWLHPLDPVRAGVLMTVTMSLGVALPYFLVGCVRLGVQPLRHILEVWLKPLIVNGIFLLMLLWARDELLDQRYLTAAIGFMAAGLMLILAYWLFAFEDWLRIRVRGRLFRLASGDLRL